MDNKIIAKINKKSSTLLLNGFHLKYLLPISTRQKYYQGDFFQLLLI